MSNPYAASTTQTVPTVDDNPIGRVGFFLSLTGVISLSAIGHFGPLISTIAMCIAFASLPGLMISFVGLFRRPRRLARWGTALGIFGSLYLPHFVVSFFHLR